MSLADHEAIAIPARHGPGRARRRKGARLALMSFFGVALITGTPPLIGPAAAQAAGRLRPRVRRPALQRSMWLRWQRPLTLLSST